MSVKRWGVSMLYHAGALAACRHWNRSALVILTYHGVLPGHDDRDDFLSGNFIAASAFEWQMRWLARTYTPIRLSDVVNAITTGRPLPPRAVAVTFDDGFANNFRYALPVLQRSGVPATVFLTTGKIGVPGAQLWTERVKRSIYLTDRARLPVVVPGQHEHALGHETQRANAAREVLGLLKRMEPTRRDEYLAEIEHLCGRAPLGPDDGDRYDFLTWDEVRTMARHGIEFGSHTESHPILATLDDASLSAELRQSKRTLEDELQTPCTTFAYPNGQPGDFGDREKRHLEQCGYRIAVSLFGGINHVIDEPFGVDRVNITRGYYPALLSAAASGVLLMGKRARSTWRRGRGPGPRGRVDAVSRKG